ncbi:MAG: type II CRISPR-associated endonuclease Cas1 [Trueperella sp.]|nr:type II CRISPR-associated endonuclease Cas1 [Trueperella sp.]
MQGDIKSARGAIRICPQETAAVEVPLEDVAVILVGTGTRFSAGAMYQLMKYDVAAVFCDWKGVPIGAVYGMREHSRVGARHRAQAELSVPRKKNAWGKIIAAKILGQANTLKEINPGRAAELAALSRAVKSGDPGNLEARAAKFYWKNLWGGEEFTRIPGNGQGKLSSSRNAQLDYAYTILRGYGIRAVLAAGLAPSLGVFHSGRSNNFALVDDLIEPLRPAVDARVAQLPSDSHMEDGDTRKALVAAATTVFTANGYTIPTVFEEFAQTYAKYVEGDSKFLTVPIWEGLADAG